MLDAVESVLGSLTDVLFVADALHTQTGHANEIAARRGQLMIPVKANQPTLFAQLKALPWAQIPAGDRRLPAADAQPADLQDWARRRLS